MAKNTAPKSVTKNASSKSAGSVAAAPKNATAKVSKSAIKAPTAKTEPFQEEAIGMTAGRVWLVLQEGDQTLSALKKSVDAPSDLVVAAVGWLAREGKLRFEPKGRSMQIGLCD
ncbi:MAG: winged helix-turn-helix domain-containing protein [Planctomycetales bacterium]|nr:winged helix-turn-helix domain-containing protein [Planctomycetales bacterium]